MNTGGFDVRVVTHFCHIPISICRRKRRHTFIRHLLLGGDHVTDLQAGMAVDRGDNVGRHRWHEERDRREAVRQDVPEHRGDGDQERPRHLDEATAGEFTIGVHFGQALGSVLDLGRGIAFASVFERQGFAVASDFNNLHMVVGLGH